MHKETLYGLDTVLAFFSFNSDFFMLKLKSIHFSNSVVHDLHFIKQGTLISLITVEVGINVEGVQKLQNK